MAILTGNLQEDNLPVTRFGGIRTNKDIVQGGSANTDLSGSTGTLKLPSGGIQTNGGATLTKFYSVVAVNTTLTTPVNVFGTTNGFAGTITSLKAISQDTSNGTVIVLANGGTLASIVKSTTAGGVTGSFITPTAFTSTGTMSVYTTAAANLTFEATFLTV